MQRHVPCLPACRCILGIRRGLNTAKIFGKQVGILAQNLSDVIETVTKNHGGSARCVPPGRGFSFFYSHLFWGRQQDHFFFFISKRYVVSKKISVHPLLSTKSAKSVSQGAAPPRTQDIKHRANHSDAVLFPSIHTHKHRVNPSSAILFKRMREKADLPNSVINDSEQR